MLQLLKSFKLVFRVKFRHDMSLENISSGLLVLVYWYLFASFFFIIRDWNESEIKKLPDFIKRFTNSYQDCLFTEDILRFKSVLTSVGDRDLVIMTKHLAMDKIKANSPDLTAHLLLFVALFKLNRALG
jgi:hypothetical protein